MRRSFERVLRLIYTPPHRSFAVLAIGFLSALATVQSFELLRARASEPKSPATSLKSLLDAPLLFVKQHPYFAGHIYDDYLTWHPGGGIYILENPADPPKQHRMRAVIDPTTNETLGEGVYRDPDLSWDATKIVFAFKGAADGHTCLYEISLDGRGLRRLTNPETDGACRPQEDRIGRGHHDITPCYLPDGRIAFTSTRPRALVPCFNSGVDTLHVMDADGSNIRSISVNNVNEFDPAVMHDGRILYGRWEYVDKTALYMQSLWTVTPDGQREEALFGNNLAKPTAILDARPVPGSRLVAAALTPHNGQAVGAIVTIDPYGGKNNLAAITNFTPEYPTEMDQGLRQGPCDPWPLSEDVMLISNNAEGHAKIQIIHRDGRREPVYEDPEISCYAPMLVKPRPRPPAIPASVEAGDTGRFLLSDIYRGLDGVERGTVKRLRIVEETARTSGLPPGGRWWNQAFLISWQGAYTVKNILGTVPVHNDGSAYFEAPTGRAIYFEALDQQNREVQRMRTFVQASPGTTRSCVGCHEPKYSAPTRPPALPLAMRSPPARPQPESWGNGYIDYATHVQPILDRHCVRCHGGPADIARGIDLSGGWTWAFNISYETLIKQRLTGFLNCNNASIHTSALLPPRSIGSGAAPLAELLLSGHDGHIAGIRQPETDLILAWMDTNSNYYGSWDYTPQATANAILDIAGPLSSVMQQAGCVRCHAPNHIGNDWVNLQQPAWSRILRAPMPRTADGLGLAMCRNRQARTGYPLVDQRVQPPDMVVASRQPEWDDSGSPVITLASSDDPYYQAMFEIIQRTRAEVLSRPRVDMPGAQIVGGQCRMNVLPALPLASPPLVAHALPDGSVQLDWPRTADTIGLQYEIHRGRTTGFVPDEQTYLGLTSAGSFLDVSAPEGPLAYALIVTSDTRDGRGTPSFAEITVPAIPPPAPPDRQQVRPLPGEVELTWAMAEPIGLRFLVFRRSPGAASFEPLTDEPIDRLEFVDSDVEPKQAYEYQVRAVDRRGRVGEFSRPVSAVPLPLIREPVFVADLIRDAAATRISGKTVVGELRGKATISADGVVLQTPGHVEYPHVPELDQRKALTVECWIRIDEPTQMPVILAHGQYQRNGWFLQRYGRGWRWHLGGVSCDGGQGLVGDWVHLVATHDGRQSSLFQNGKLVATVAGQPNHQPWNGPLYVGQYDPNGRADYQVQGMIAGIKVYQRALSENEASEAYRRGRPATAGS